MGLPEKRIKEAQEQPILLTLMLDQDTYSRLDVLATSLGIPIRDLAVHALRYGIIDVVDIIDGYLNSPMSCN